MNLAIYPNGGDEIAFFVTNARKTGPNDYAGDNLRVTGVKPLHWCFLWTNDAAEPIRNNAGEIIGWGTAVTALAPCPMYRGEPVGSDADVDRVTAAAIAAAYPPDEEAKLLRRQLAGTIDPAEWQAYNDYVESVVAAGRAVKTLLRGEMG